jgi:hypothetical protein
LGSDPDLKMLRIDFTAEYLGIRRIAALDLARFFYKL